MIPRRSAGLAKLMPSVAARLQSTMTPKELDAEFQKSVHDLAPKYQSNPGTQTKNGVLPVAEALQLINSRSYNLLSLDIEHYERHSQNVLELGVSVYKPAYQAHALFPHIVNFHIILKEGLNYFNGKYVPDNRLKNVTGQSILATKTEAIEILAKIFEELDVSKTLLVGHGIGSDLSVLRKWGLQIPETLRVVDTTKLWLSLRITSKKSALWFVLDKLGIPYAFLHNAVNDSYYTLVACLMLSSPEIRNNLVAKDLKFDLETEEELEVRSVRCSPSDESLDKRGPVRNSSIVKPMYFHLPVAKDAVKFVEDKLKELP